MSVFDLHFPQNLRDKRRDQKTRDQLAEVHISTDLLIQPYFVYEGLASNAPLSSLYLQKKHSIDSLKKEIELGLKAGVKGHLLFVIPMEKRESDFDFSFDAEAISAVKNTFGKDITLYTDLCLCSNTLSGHCGLIDQRGHIDNHPSVIELAKKALIYAQAGADCISPSDMMDDRVQAIRQILDENNLNDVTIMSYSSKFSSHFYGPFREAAESTPAKGDRKSYQIDCRNKSDAVESSLRDWRQKATILMVKPALPYLDIIQSIKQHPQMGATPLAAYQVSGEYQSLYLMGEKGYMNFEMAYIESLYAIKRAGADFIISYGANHFKQWIER